MTILIGCSGWSYDDWVGPFYPVRLAARKGEWLAYYGRYFPTVEINSSFYQAPGERQVQSWIRKARGLEGFQYSLKMPRKVTHEAMVKGDLVGAVGTAGEFVSSTVRPLAREGLAGAVLLQLSPGFRKDEASLRLLGSLLSSVGSEVPLAVEFRNQSWLDPQRHSLDAATLEVLREDGASLVWSDGPGFPTIEDLTANHVYTRFHGRNFDLWFRRVPVKEDLRLDRYDYLYTREQLMPWVSRIRRAQEMTREVRIYFNNHARGRAAKNALEMMDLLSIPHVPKGIHPQDQHRLDSF